MKKILQLVVSLLHPIAVVLVWISLAGRRDLSGAGKLAWALVALLPAVPFIYVLLGNDLW